MRSDVELLNNDEICDSPNEMTSVCNIINNNDDDCQDEQEEHLHACKTQLKATFEHLLEEACTVDKVKLIEAYLKNAVVALSVNDTPLLKVLPGPSSPLLKQKRF